jgi:hypothetical protein
MRAVDRVSLRIMPKSRPGEHCGFTSALCGNSEQPQIPKKSKIFFSERVGVEGHVINLVKELRPT